MPSLLQDFLHDNSITVGSLYEAFRYPTDKNFVQIRRYSKLKYTGANGVQFFTELKGDLATLRTESVRLGRSFGNGEKQVE